LSEDGRRKASLIFKTLTQSQNVNDARKTLEKHGFQIDYVEEHWGRRFAAVFLEGVRLIDNVSIAN
jgi:pantoate--beta-alanine ligase